MQKKEYYKHNLPYFQQPGQAYFVTWSLKDAVPKHVLKHFSLKLEILKSQIDNFSKGAADKVTADSDPQVLSRGLESARPERIEKLKREYYFLRKRYLKAYDDFLDAQKNPEVDLSKPAITNILKSSLLFWEGKRLYNYAFCIMPNHVHWVFKVLEKDEKGEPAYLQDILYSVKRFSATKINKEEKRKDALWQKESFDTTIRDHKHLPNAIEYTLNNSVKAGFVQDRNNWSGNWCVD